MAKEYIERESVLKCVAEDGRDCEYDLGYWSHNVEFQELIKEIPAADVVEVVRCRDCIFWDTSWNPGVGVIGEAQYCPRCQLVTLKDSFCSGAYRKDVGQDE